MKNLAWILLFLTSLSFAQERDSSEIEKALKGWEMYHGLLPEVDKLAAKMRQVRTDFEKEIDPIDHILVKTWLKAYNERLEWVKVHNDSMANVYPLAKTKLEVLYKWKEARIYTGTEMLVPLRGMYPELDEIGKELHEKYGEQIAQLSIQWQQERRDYMDLAMRKMSAITNQPYTPNEQPIKAYSPFLHGTLTFFCIEPY